MHAHQEFFEVGAATVLGPERLVLAQPSAGAGLKPRRFDLPQQARKSRRQRGDRGLRTLHVHHPGATRAAGPVPSHRPVALRTCATA